MTPMERVDFYLASPKFIDLLAWVFELEYQLENDPEYTVIITRRNGRKYPRETLKFKGSDLADLVQNLFCSSLPQSGASPKQIIIRRESN